MAAVTAQAAQPPRIRTTQAGDEVACAAIYAPYVLETPISFELTPPTPAQMAERIRAAHLWLVAERDGTVVGFAYAGAHNPREAYRWSADVSVYVDAASHGRGIGRALYATLFERLRERGFCMVCAGITEPNEASNALHESLGFVEVGTYRRIGFKGGRWHDVRWMQLEIDDGGPAPPDPRGPAL